MRKYTTRLRLTSTVISCTFAAAGKRTSGYDIRSAAPSSRFVLPTPINLLRATTPLVSYIIHHPWFYYCCRFSVHARAHTHAHIRIRSFHREIYFSFYFFPLTHPLTIVSSTHLYSHSDPRRPLRRDPYIDVHNCAAVSVFLAGARKTRQCPAEWRHRWPQQWVVFSTVYIFIKENFYGSTVVFSTHPSTDRPTDKRTTHYYHLVESIRKTIILSYTRLSYSLGVGSIVPRVANVSRILQVTHTATSSPFKQSRIRPFCRLLSRQSPI